MLSDVYMGRQRRFVQNIFKAWPLMFACRMTLTIAKLRRVKRKVRKLIIKLFTTFQSTTLHAAYGVRCWQEP